MVRAQNDLYMVVTDSEKNSGGDNALLALQEGSLTRGELQRCAMNICRFLMHSQCMEERTGEDAGATDDTLPSAATLTPDFVIRDGAVLSTDGIDTTRGTNTVYTTLTEEAGTYKVTATASSEAGGVAQIPLTRLAAAPYGHVLVCGHRRASSGKRGPPSPWKPARNT